MPWRCESWLLEIVIVGRDLGVGVIVCVFNGKKYEELLFREFKEALESKNPPDIILDPRGDIIQTAEFAQIDRGLFHNVEELTKQYAPTIYMYLNDFEVLRRLWIGRVECFFG